MWGSGLSRKNAVCSSRDEGNRVVMLCFLRFMPIFSVLLQLIPALFPQQKHTHRQRCAFCKGFQHYGGECCHFALHRTMVSAAVMTTRTITNPSVKQISSLMTAPSFPFDSPGGRRWFWTFQVSALLLPRSSRHCARMQSPHPGRFAPMACGPCTCPPA